jgi:hypothetical protein
MRISLLSRATASVAVLALLLAGCGGGDDGEQAEEVPTPEETVEPEPEPQRWPLTGAVAEGEIDPGHPVLVVKIDNTARSQPQAGLGSADLIVEQMVEGNYTRLAAFYHSDLPELVGPVRSLRTSDVNIVSPVDAHLVTSGAAGPVHNRMRNAELTVHQEGASGIFRARNRSAPYNVMADLTTIGQAAGDAELPKPYLSWGEASDVPEGESATSISTNFGGRDSQWNFRDGKYRNTNTYAPRGDRFIADTVLAIRVPVGDAGYRDPAGNFVPDLMFQGSGDAVLFHGGVAVEATWHKERRRSAVHLTVGDDEELLVPAGRTWIALMPDNAGGIRWSD